jgi:hypothetical protein
MSGTAPSPDGTMVGDLGVIGVVAVVDPATATYRFTVLPPRNRSRRHPLLSVNGTRGLPGAAATRIATTWRDQAKEAATAARVPPLGRARLLLVIRLEQPRGDPQNYPGAPAIKGLIDGLVEAGIVQDDGPRYLDVLMPRLVRAGAAGPRVDVFLWQLDGHAEDAPPIPPDPDDAPAACGRCSGWAYLFTGVGASGKRAYRPCPACNPKARQPIPAELDRLVERLLACPACRDAGALGGCATHLVELRTRAAQQAGGSTAPQPDSAAAHPSRRRHPR